jgi:hypothetical protein
MNNGPLKRILAALAAVVLLAGAASARPDPCTELAAIVGAYHNQSTNRGKTAGQLFTEMGKLTVLAKLGQAAAHVQDHEPDGIGINVISPNADAAYAELSGKIRWLGAADLNGYSGVSLSPAYAATPLFCTSGMLGGIYARANAAALVGRMTDALFIAFRATNDGWNLTGTPVTPDALDWTRQDRHYKRYEYLLSAIGGYLAAHPEIAHVYVAGDSLGAAVAQRYMLKHRNDGRLRAYLFGSPGNPSVAFQDRRIWTFLNDIDPVLLVPALRYKLSGKRFLIHLGLAPAVPPNAVFHDPQAYVRIMQHLDRHGVGAGYLGSKFAGGSAGRWNAIFVTIAALGKDPEDFDVGVPGHIATLPGSDPRLMAGGDGDDVITGGIGSGDLFGFGGSDCLEAGNGSDRLTGGGGHDRFILHGSSPLFGGRIMDFASGFDQIVALGTLPAGTPLRDGRNFVRGTVARHRLPSLIYDRDGGQLFFDMDGTGPFFAYQIGRFPRHPKILASDIALERPKGCN